MIACNKCGAPATEIVISRDGNDVAAGALCGPCLDAACAEMDLARQEFEALLAAGVPRDRANDLMIAKYDGRGAKA